MARRAWHLGHVEHLAAVQDGVVARRQILAAGGTDGDITRLLRRRELTQVYRGVYVNHTGRLTGHSGNGLGCWPIGPPRWLTRRHCLTRRPRSCMSPWRRGGTCDRCRGSSFIGRRISSHVPNFIAARPQFALSTQ